MTIDPPARYNVHTETASSLVLREKLWPRVLIFLVCEVFPLVMLVSLKRDSGSGDTFKTILAVTMIVTMIYGVLQLLLVGNVEIIDSQKVIKYRAWGRKYRLTPLILDVSSLYSIDILKVPTRGPYIYEVRLKRRVGAPVLLDRSHGDHVERIAIAVAKHTGLPIDSYMVP